MVKTGILLNIAGIIVATLVMYFWGTLVFGIDVTVFPEWAK
jgi:sodium-dependent dicarboxylate transporter 2/3/5